VRKAELPDFNQKENGPDRGEGGGEPRGQDRRISMTEDRIDTNRIRAACKQKIAPRKRHQQISRDFCRSVFNTFPFPH
jgi:hypothetical protein